MLAAHTYMQAAVFQLLWSEFEAWLLNENKDITPLTNCADGLKNLLEGKSGKMPESENIAQLYHLLDEFRVQCSSPTAQLL